MDEKDYYLDEDGLMVFTEAYHKKRGFCCGCGCKHCPFDYKAVKEPRRSDLIAKRMKGMTNGKGGIADFEIEGFGE